MLNSETYTFKLIIKSKMEKKPLRGQLHGAFSMSVFMSDKQFVAEACPPMSHASASIKRFVGHRNAHR
jgi:hypothetical protein